MTFYCGILVSDRMPHTERSCSTNAFDVGECFCVMFNISQQLYTVSCCGQYITADLSLDKFIIYHYVHTSRDVFILVIKFIFILLVFI